MKCNRQRLKEAADRRIGERYDYGITVGIKLAALACHRRFGFGRARLEILDREITALLGEITQGAAQQKTPGWDAWGNEIESDIIL